MLLSYVLDAGRGGHGMDDLAKRHLGHTCISYKELTGSGKSAITFDFVDIEKATRYAAEDADVTLRLVAGSETTSCFRGYDHSLRTPGTAID